MTKTTNDNITPVRGTKLKKDFPARRNVKGGGRQPNHNITLVRATTPTPTKKDLPARTDVKGGRPAW
jgi:hypothetical protein